MGTGDFDTNLGEASLLQDLGLSKASLSQALLGFLNDDEYSDLESEPLSEGERERAEELDQAEEPGMPSFVSSCYISQLFIQQKISARKTIITEGNESERVFN